MRERVCVRDREREWEKEKESKRKLEDFKKEKDCWRWPETNLRHLEVEILLKCCSWTRTTISFAGLISIISCYFQQHFMHIFVPPGVNFTNMFTRSFYTCRSQKLKMTDYFTVLLRSMGVIASCKMLVKLTPGVNFIKKISRLFGTKVLFAAFL